MQKQLLAFVLITASLLGILFMVFSFSNSNSGEVKSAITFEKDAIIYYYGNTCPHCAVLNDWLKENKIADKVKFAKKEVYSNQQNSLELQAAAKECGLDTSSIGVPFVYAKGSCYVGSDKAKEFFQKESAR